MSIYYTMALLTKYSNVYEYKYCLYTANKFLTNSLSVKAAVFMPI